MTSDTSYILCIETANTVTSVAISVNGKCLAVKEVAAPNKAADNLHLLIEELLQEASISFSSLSAIAVSSGPGSYTGLRIAVSAAKGYCFSLDIPLISVPTLQAMAHGIKERYYFIDTYQYVPMIDARRMEIYISFFTEDLQPGKLFSSLVIDEGFEQLFETNKKYVLFGSGSGKARSVVTGNNITFFDEFIPSAADMCGIAYEKLIQEAVENVAYFEPDYAKPYYSTANN